MKKEYVNMKIEQFYVSYNHHHHIVTEDLFRIVENPKLLKLF